MKDEKVIYEVQIPANTTATVILPKIYVSNSDKQKYQNYTIDEATIQFSLGSGKYYFCSQNME